AKAPYKEHVRRHTTLYRRREEQEPALAELQPNVLDLYRFLDESVGEGTRAGAMRRLRGLRRRGREAESIMPFLFPTRPYTAEEIALFVPGCISGEQATREW